MATENKRPRIGGPLAKKPTDQMRRAMARTAREDGTGRLSFLASIVSNEERRENVAAIIHSMMAQKEDGEAWRGLFAVPAGSPLETVLSAFYAGTDIPLEIPFFGFLHFVSGMLMAEGVKIEGPIGSMSPELWTVVLASSGAGKTWAVETIEETSPVKSNFSQPASAAALLENLAENPWSLWTQDEIAQILKQIEKPDGPLGAEAKEYLLKAYSNSRIERKTLRKTTVVDRPVLGLLGFNTPESFKKSMTPESLLDGFAQRFGFVWAEDDPGRPMIDFPLYDKPAILRECRKAFEQLVGVPIHPIYKIGADGKDAFKSSFRLLGGAAAHNKSFFRRAMFRAFKYAALYHVILGKEGDVLDAVDIGWGARAAKIHLADMGKVIGQQTKSSTPGSVSEFDALAGKVERVKALVERRKATGKETTARDVARALSGIKNAEEARTLLAMLGVPVKKRGGGRA